MLLPFLLILRRAPRIRALRRAGRRRKLRRWDHSRAVTRRHSASVTCMSVSTLVFLPSLPHHALRRAVSCRACPLVLRALSRSRHRQNCTPAAMPCRCPSEGMNGTHSRQDGRRAPQKTTPLPMKVKVLSPSVRQDCQGGMSGKNWVEGSSQRPAHGYVPPKNSTSSTIS